MIIWGAKIFALAGLLYGCATPTSPLGGEVDESPPQVIEEESTPNLQTNFEKQTIELTFDEWVILEKIREEVLISPPLSADPEIKLKRRTVQVIFQDTVDFRENVTYTINFGEAVKDLNEKNPAEDLRFVFSTGDFIDSLSISGTIVEAQTGEPVEKVLFMLYENLADTVVRTERPFYFGRTDEEGHFVIENIREGVYKGFALEDTGIKKYIFDAGERLSFPDSLIRIRPDTAIELDLRMFAEAIPLLINEVDTSRYGKVKLTFNQPVFDLGIEYADIVDTPTVRVEKDSMIFWYDQETPWTLFLQQDTLFRDTFRIGAGGKATFLQTDTLRAARTNKNTKVVPGQPPVIGYNHPLEAFDTSLVSLYVDTLRRRVVPGLLIDPLNPRQTMIDYRWLEGMTYELEFLPGAVTDMYGLSNPDSLVINYSLDPLSSYGNILLSLSNLDSAEYYVVQLLSKDLERTIVSDTVSGMTTYEVEWKTISPGDYTLRVITDWNRNGRWDTGNYDLQRQPEPIYLRPLDKLRANWDLEAIIQLGEVVEEPEPAETTNANSPSGRN